MIFKIQAKYELQILCETLLQSLNCHIYPNFLQRGHFSTYAAEYQPAGRKILAYTSKIYLKKLRCRMLSEISYFSA